MRAAGKEATREAQNRGRGYRGVAGLARSSPGAARAFFISIFAQDLDPGLRPGSVVSCFWTGFPCACIVGSTGTEKPIVAGLNHAINARSTFCGAQVLSSFVFLDTTGLPNTKQMFRSSPLGEQQELTHYGDVPV